MRDGQRDSCTPGALYPLRWLCLDSFWGADVCLLRGIHARLSCPVLNCVLDLDFYFKKQKQKQKQKQKCFV